MAQKSASPGAAQVVLAQASSSSPAAHVISDSGAMPDDLLEDALATAVAIVRAYTAQTYSARTREHLQDLVDQIGLPAATAPAVLPIGFGSTAYQNEIIAKYLEAAAADDEDAEMTDSDASSDASSRTRPDASDGEDEDAVMECDDDSVAAAKPDDIASDDATFSSDDEFGSPAALKEQRNARLLVLGRPPADMLRKKPRVIVGLVEAHIAELADVEEQLREATGAVPPLDKKREGVVAHIRAQTREEMNKRTTQDLVWSSLVPLAQAVFRRKRQLRVHG